MDNKENKIQHLQELIRSATVHLLSKDERISYIKDDNLKNRLFGKYPKCFITLYRKDAPVLNLPICNRIGIVDVDVINISYKTVQKIMEDKYGEFDVNDLTKILSKLDALKNKYEKPIPKPPVQAGVKGNVTRMFNNIKNHLNTSIRNKE